MITLNINGKATRADAEPDTPLARRLSMLDKA